MQGRRESAPCTGGVSCSWRSLLEYCPGQSEIKYPLDIFTYFQHKEEVCSLEVLWLRGKVPAHMFRGNEWGLRIARL